MNRTKKVAIVGAGYVGTSIAADLMSTHACGEIVMINRSPEKAWAEAEDLRHGLGFCPDAVKISAGGFESASDADLIVIAAAVKYTPGVSDRLRVLHQNFAIMQDIIPKIMETGFSGIFFIVTNPVDMMSWAVWKLSGLPAHKVIGSGTILDSSRLRYFLTDYLPEYAPNEIDAWSIGEHGESQFIPWSVCTVHGKPILELLKERHIDIDTEALLKRVKDAPIDVIAIKGPITFGIGASCGTALRSILLDQRRVLPVSVMLNGQYGQKGIFAGVPVLLGAEGVMDIIEYQLTEDEKSLFSLSSNVIRTNCNALGL
jgi:L-lactate dehydrogenase